MSGQIKLPAGYTLEGQVKPPAGYTLEEKSAESTPIRKPLEMPKRPGFLSIAGEAIANTAGDIFAPVEAAARTIAGIPGFMVGTAATLGAKTLGGKNWQEAREVGSKVAETLSGGPTTITRNAPFFQEMASPLMAPFALPGMAAQALAPEDPEIRAMLATAADVAMLIGPALKGNLKARLKGLQERAKAGKVNPAEVKAFVEKLEEVKAKQAEPGVAPDIAKAKAMEAAGVASEGASPVTPSPLAAEGSIRGGQIMPNMELPKRVGPINLERLDIDKEAKINIANIEDRLHAERQAAKAGHRWDEVAEKAKVRGAAVDIGEQLGRTYEEVMAEFGKRTSGEGGLDVAVLAAREVLATAHRDFMEAFRQYRANPTPEGQALVEMMRGRVEEVQRTVGAGSSNVGRALNIHKKIVKAKDYLLNKQMDMVFKELGKERLDQEAMDIIAALDGSDPTAVMKFLAEKRPATFRQKAFELWMNSILTNPLTHAKNITSNAVTMLWRAGETGISEGPGVASANAIGTLRGVKDGFKLAWERMKGDIDPNDVSKIEVPTRAIKGKLGHIVRTPTRALGAEDAVFKTAIYEGKIYSEAYKQATREGLRGQERRARVEEIAKNPTEGMKKAAHEEALYGTFNDKLSGIAADVARMRQRSAVPVEFIIPFVRTPYNVAKYGLQRTVLGIPDLIIKARKGTIPRSEVVKRAASIGFTTAANVAIAQMIMDGTITGSGPTDPKERATLYAQGWQPRSVKLGNTYYGYGGIEPLSTIFGIYADFWDIKHRATNLESNKIVGLVASSLRNNLLDKTFMSGLMNVLKASDDPERYGADWVKQMSGSVVPAVVAGTARSLDPNLREAQSIIDTIKSRIPGLTGQVPEKLGPFGETSRRAGTPLSRMFSPVPMSQAIDDPVYKELGRLGIRISTPTLTVKGGNGKAEKAPREEQRRLIRAAMPDVKAAVLRVINSPQYQRMPDEVKKKFIESQMNKTRAFQRKLFILENKQ
jgi:hypothetical protein